MTEIAEDQGAQDKEGGQAETELDLKKKGSVKADVLYAENFELDFTEDIELKPEPPQDPPNDPPAIGELFKAMMNQPSRLLVFVAGALVTLIIVLWFMIDKFCG